MLNPRASRPSVPSHHADNIFCDVDYDENDNGIAKVLLNPGAARLHVPSHHTEHARVAETDNIFITHTGKQQQQGKGQNRQLLAINWNVNLDLAQ